MSAPEFYADEVEFWTDLDIDVPIMRDVEILQVEVIDMDALK